MPVGLPTERRRVAEILVALGPERAAGMLRNLPQEEVTRIASDMAAVDLSPEDAKEVLKELPLAFAVEAQKLLGVSLEGAVG